MRDPEIFKFDVRVRERMLRNGRITADEVNRALEALPDLETSIESVPLIQPAIDGAALMASTSRQAVLATAPDEDGEDQGQHSGDTT